MSFLGGTIGIDIGTFSTRILKNNGLNIYSQPSVVAVNKSDRRIIAVGSDAIEIIGRMPNDVTAVNPVVNGVITDFDIFRIYLKKVLMNTHSAGVIKPTAVIAASSGMTNVQKRAIEEAALTSGIKTVRFVSKVMAAISGCGIKDTSANIIVDIGAETAEIAVISFGEIVSAKTLYMNGNTVEDSIINFLKKEFGIVIGKQIAGDIKTKIGILYEPVSVSKMTVCGRDVSSGLPKQAEINSKQIYEVIRNDFISIGDEIKNVIEITPSEIIGDAIKNGILFTGGNSKTEGLSEFMSSYVGIDCICAENPCECVIMGIGNMIGKKIR